MKRLRLLWTALLIAVVTFPSYSQNWEQVWSDEFTNGIGPDWVFDIGDGGWGNNEKQFYRQENATVENGHLVITAKNEFFGGSSYTSARMKTQGRKSWKYGKIEARMKLPAFQGSWPAFWMLGDNISSVGWPQCGEIDILEQTNTSNTVLGTIHWDNNGYVHYGGNTSTNVTDFHVYAVEWDANEIRWYVDGNHFHTVNIQNNVNSTHEFHNNFFIILNMAIGGNLAGNNINNGALPSSLRVDYVRVYEATTGVGGGAPIGQTVWLKGSNGLYVSSEGGQSSMNCNRNSVQAWEQFVVVDAGGGKVALRGTNGQYVSSEDGLSGMNCNRTTIGGWEVFDWVDNGNGTISLRGSNGLYVSSEDGQSAMICDRTGIQGWEQFTWGGGTPGARKGSELASLEETSLENNISIYPNPITQHYFNVEWAGADTEAVKISLMDLSGREQFATVVKGGTKQVAIPDNIGKGAYILVLRSDSQRFTENVFIK